VHSEITIAVQIDEGQADTLLLVELDLRGEHFESAVTP